MRGLIATGALLLVLPASSGAQATAAAAIALGGIDKLLDRVESIDLYFGGNLSARQSGTATHYRVPWGRDYGVEFGFHVGDYGSLRSEVIQRQDSTTKAYLAKLSKAKGGATSRDTADARAAAKQAVLDVTSITIKKHLTVANGDTVVVAIDSEFVGERRQQKGESLWQFDLGIGYGQLDGVATTTPYELRGYVRELPSIALYATYRVSKRLSVYTGARSGIVSLQDAQLFVKADTTTSVFTLSATTFEVGLPVGIDVSLTNDVDIALEGSLMRRYFNSISFNPVANFPRDYPHSVDLSGWSWDLGLSFPIPKKG